MGAHSGNSTLNYLGAHVSAYSFITVSQVETNLPLPPESPNFQELYNASYDCAFNMFGVHLARVNWSDKGVSGEMQFAPAEGTEIKVWNRWRPWKYSAVQKSFSIYNDTVTYAYEAPELGNKGGAAIGYSYEGEGQTGIFYETRDTGIENSTNRTFTANNRETKKTSIENTLALGLGFNGYITSQIQEAGNALSTITGRNPEPAATWNERELGKDDSDSGQSFEACVFLNYRRRVGIDK